MRQSCVFAMVTPVSAWFSTWTVLLGLFCGILLEMFAMAEAKFVM